MISLSLTFFFFFQCQIDSLWQVVLKLILWIAQWCQQNSPVALRYEILQLSLEGWKVFPVIEVCVCTSLSVLLLLLLSIVISSSR